MRLTGFALAAGAVSAAALFCSHSAAHAQDFRAQYRVGQQVSFSISERPDDFQTCTVVDNTPDAVMRVRCNAFKHWAAGNYIVYGAGNIRPLGAAPPRSPAQTVRPQPPAPQRPTTRPAQPRPPAAGRGGTIRVAEYMCVGSGGRILIGLGFRVTGAGRYTDLEGGNAGSFTVGGGRVTFRGGHLDGQVGRDIDAYGGFTIGAGAHCAPN